MGNVDLSGDNLVVLQDDLDERGVYVMRYRGPIDQVYLYGDHNRSRIIIPNRDSPLGLHMGVLREGVQFQEGSKVTDADLLEVSKGKRTLPLDEILTRVGIERASLRFVQPTPSSAQPQSPQ